MYKKTAQYSCKSAGLSGSQETKGLDLGLLWPSAVSLSVLAHKMNSSD